MDTVIIRNVIGATFVMMKSSNSSLCRRASHAFIRTFLDQAFLHCSGVSESLLTVCDRELNIAVFGKDPKGGQCIEVSLTPEMFRLSGFPMVMFKISWCPLHRLSPHRLCGLAPLETHSVAS
ncbi:hypothetical protein AQUCO_01800153v1 [Aquilegia coerulea]|uniref:Uncharacterized protein n=1 Tax=Aquilegia coerulea TaxID=218851 RepID=A0A2G5DKX9_AQUCA|nr:hypothetical protein AQUCO_01800153v1 [Aquilegia coerulea]